MLYDWLAIASARQPRSTAGKIAGTRALYVLLSMTLAMEDLEYAYLEDSPSDCSVPQPECFRVAPDYDYHKSTEQNYSTDVVEFVGKYAALRSKLDYDYHKHYTPSRQLLHDQIISRFTEVEIDDGEYTCEVPEENWSVFTSLCFVFATFT